MSRSVRSTLLAAVMLLAANAAMAAPDAPVTTAGAFTIAVIPDTQNYVDFTHQTEAGFPFDAREIFLDQMRFIARNAKANGGDVAFAIGVGDAWQHPTSRAVDEPHSRAGLKAVANPLFDAHLPPDPRTRTVEMPTVRAGYALVAAAGLPFAVVPGNHDYDANWSDSRFPPAADPFHPGTNRYPFGQLHYGGLTNFNAVFGADTPFFKGKPWYLSGYHGGADSAATFTAGGYRFLHIGLEMAPEADVLRWAQAQVDAHPGLPTIVTIHDHLNPKGERKPNPAVDFKLVQPSHNDAEDLWRKFLSRNDQIFLVVSGHQHGQSHRTDLNANGHAVHQVLADYQDRNQTLAAIREPKKMGEGLGDGWLRLMRFDLTGAVPRITVSTYSTYYKSTAEKLPSYARFYRDREKPGYSDTAFVAEETFTLPLDDFAKRFAAAAIRETAK